VASHPRRPTSRARTSRSRRLVVALIAAALLAGIWSGCSVEKHYELLSFFFDGVPDPATLAAEREAAGRRGRTTSLGVIQSAHTAFIERRCEECHGASTNFGFQVSGFSQLDSDICLECHESVLTNVPQLHGPVAAQDCLWCHDPHESRFEKLLVTDSPTLCLSCHRFQMQRPPQPEVHQDLTRDCLECHRGHGGDERPFLRADGGSPLLRWAATPLVPAS
jgi:predicted CXXCH cytochrome family protein